MEFNEKFRMLRKSKGLTQEEMADALNVSRTAVSKWESGRGYPSIDSLKDISAYFSVTIDDLLSGEKLLSIAEKENKHKIRGLCDMLFGFADLFSFMLIILPIYPNEIDGYIFSVNLSDYTRISETSRTIYWIMFVSIVVAGALKLILTKVGAEKSNKILTEISTALNIMAVLFLVLTREAYAASLLFFLLTAKGIILLKYAKSGNV